MCVSLHPTIKYLTCKGKHTAVLLGFSLSPYHSLNSSFPHYIHSPLLPPFIAHSFFASSRPSGAKVILSSHLGRPKGGFEAKFSLAPITPRLSELLGQPVALVSDCIGEPVATAVAAMKDGDVVLLENVRFYPEEEKNDKVRDEQSRAPLGPYHRGQDSALYGVTVVHDTLYELDIIVCVRQSSY